MLTSLAGGGLWHPEAAPTAAMRRAFDRHPQRLKDVLKDDGLRKEFLKGAPKNDAKVVKAFVAQPSNAESALKTKPKVSLRSLFHCLVYSCVVCRVFAAQRMAAGLVCLSEPALWLDGPSSMLVLGRVEWLSCSWPLH